MSDWAVLVAAGRGTRAHLDKNKVLYPIQGRCALLRALDAFARAGIFRGVMVVLSATDMEQFQALLRSETDFGLIITSAIGGDTRQQSVFNGLRSLPENADVVCIHDAARPFVSEDILRKSVALAHASGSGVVCTPVTDTVFSIEAGGGSIPLERSRLRALQTPQSFRFEEILAAHRRAARDGFSATDDASLYAKYCADVHFFVPPDAEKNIKLTTKEDFMRFNPLSELRIGSGYDAHRLVAGRPLILCGIHIPHDRGLDGHSDADVAVHALMDALLGALAEGDIGRHFPDTDAQYRGISSMLLLDRVVHLVHARGYVVQNCDVTIVAQRPKLLPHLEQMRARLADSLAIGPACVNVKATTTERMGFEGEETGISAQAVVLLRRQSTGEVCI